MNVFVPYPDINLNELPHYESSYSVPEYFCDVCYIIEDRAILWRKNGRPHNSNGPAVIWTPRDDSSQYFGYKYYMNGQLHRLNGPAWHEKTLKNNECFFIYGKEFEKEKFWNHSLVVKKIFETILEL